ncbi:fatty acid desaturase [Hoeflea poritis]|uniref:Fatty acid desaturase n=1 Tax=Hoeflea poritis TaxID=2993659 RepID=A0ABT4VVZ3_9HYPH|nr:fatty acid desaturase [Hoeflea poritis]MDA4848884.1 fatty acid desaturase [Hoeflea poritis]
MGRLAQYRGPNPVRSTTEIAITLFGFLAIWLTIWLGLNAGYWQILVLALPGAGFLVRLFMIQHDCGHGSFFRRRRTNDWTGRFLSILTLTPYDYWKRSHAAHHAGSGNLDRRGIGDITTLTVDEYRGLSRFGRVGYRLYRNPIVLFVLGPAFLFLFQHRLPVGDFANARAWTSVMATNVAMATLVTAFVLLVGPQQFLIIHMPIVLIAASAGVWLFYVQHQFEGTSWARNEAWQVHEFALNGSSYYALPTILRWFTANIGMHHIHHLCARIPFYKLPAAIEEDPALKRMGKLTLRESLHCVPLALWDEQNGRLISFAEFYCRHNPRSR